jgi:hypothetical protein
VNDNGDISELPDVPRLMQLMQSLAMLDAILSPEWDYRWYSFNSRWAEDERMGSIRNGSGDELFALFTAAGCFIKGFDHEQADYQTPATAFYSQLPEPFAKQAMEPAFSPDDATFCLWRGMADAEWHRVTVEAYSPGYDGSEWLLELFDGRPDSYRAFAKDYFEVELGHEEVAALYAHRPLTEAMVRALNPDADWPAARQDAHEIGYPTAETEERNA